jgi:hypothetical protein
MDLSHVTDSMLYTYGMLAAQKVMAAEINERLIKKASNGDTAATPKQVTDAIQDAGKTKALPSELNGQDTPERLEFHGRHAGPAMGSSAVVDLRLLI